MIKFPTFEEKAEIRGIKFEIMDLSVDFFHRVEQDSEIYCDYEILKDASTLTDEEILSLGNREKLAIVEKILDITNPQRHDKEEDSENGKK